MVSLVMRPAFADLCECFADFAVETNREPQRWQRSRKGPQRETASVLPTCLIHQHHVEEDSQDVPSQGAPDQRKQWNKPSEPTRCKQMVRNYDYPADPN